MAIFRRRSSQIGVLHIAGFTSWDNVSAAGSGADTDQINNISSWSSGDVASMQPGFQVGACIRGPTQEYSFSLGVPYDKVIGRVKFRPTSLASERMIIGIKGTVDMARLFLRTDGKLAVPNDINGALTVVSTYPALVANMWYDIEFGARFGDTSGQVFVKVNGVFVPDLQIINWDTAVGTGIRGFDTVYLDNVDGDYDENYVLVGIGDLAQKDFLTDTLGNPRVVTLFPNSEGFWRQWREGVFEGKFDFTALIDQSGGVNAGDTTAHMESLDRSPVIGESFSIQGLPTSVYMVTDVQNLAAGEADVSFTPGATSNWVNGAVVNFTGLPAQDDEHHLAIDEAQADDDGSFLFVDSPQSGLKESWGFQNIVSGAGQGSISSAPVAEAHPGSHASDLWEDRFSVVPELAQGKYFYDDPDGIFDVTLVATERLRMALTVVVQGGEQREATQIALWNPESATEAPLLDANGIERYYSFALTLPTDWTLSEHRTIVAEWREAATCLSIEVVRDEIHVVQTLAGERARKVTLTNALGKRHNFTLRAIWSTSTAGQLELFRDGVEIMSLEGVNVDGSAGVHMRLGPRLPDVFDRVFPAGFARAFELHYFFRGSKGTPLQTLPVEDGLSIGGILGVEVVARCRAIGTGSSTRKLGPVFARIGGADFPSLAGAIPFSSPFIPFDTWDFVSQRWDLNPATGSSWTAAELNAAEFGVQQITTQGMRLSQFVVVVMYIDTAPKVASVPGTVSILRQRTHHLASLFKVERLDGLTPLYYTDHNASILFEGKTYKPMGGFDSTARRREAGLREPNTEVRGVITSDDITVQDLRSGRYRGAKVQELVVDWRFPWLGPIQTSVYSVEEVKYNGLNYVAQLGGVVQQLRHKVGNYYSRVCRKKLGDDECKVDLQQLTIHECKVNTIITQRRVFRADSTLLPSVWPDGWFNFGKVQWFTGANKGMVSEIKTYTQANREIVLQLQTPYDIATTDTFHLVPGCNQLFDGDCLTKYNNRLNFGGHPHIPGSDRAFQSPVSFKR